jgi:ribosome-associated protein YbcJ (S4-like RNA binding protein)
MGAKLHFADYGSAHRAKFVLVNHRVPRNDEHCALRGCTIGSGYIRDLQTRFIYCDTQCLAGGVYAAMPVTKNRWR